MKATEDNPDINKLHAGADETQLIGAIKKSGYPLQTIVADQLRPQFGVQEEWSFIDQDTGSLRTLDIRAERRLFEHTSQSRVRPTLELLIECKQSDLPFVFFTSGSSVPTKQFPFFAGLFQNKISIKTDDSRSTWTLSVTEALELGAEKFVSKPPSCCMSFSKCARKGKELELSGTESYQSIVLPMVKAVRYFNKQVEPPSTAHYHDLYLALAIAVVDAPMISARITADAEELILTPWVRVIRNEAVEGDHYFDRSQFLAIDIVHKGFFCTFIKEHVLPFASEFSTRALRHDVELATGKGFVPGMEANWSKAIESRLRRR